MRALYKGKAKRLLLVLLLFFAATGIIVCPAHALTVLKFDTISIGSYSETVFSDKFSGVSFDNTGKRESGEEEGFLVQSFSALGLGSGFSGNVVINDPYGTPGNSTIATFDVLVNYVSVTMGDLNGDKDMLYLYAYNSSGSEVASATFTNLKTSYAGEILSVLDPDGKIQKVEFWGVGTTTLPTGELVINNNSVYWDNFSFGEVPEPMSLSLLGIGLLGLLKLNRKKRA